jgi:hypothetical protein
VVIVAVIVGFVVELAHGRDGNPFTWLGALGDLAYMAALVVMRLRGQTGTPHPAAGLSAHSVLCPRRDRT